ncbi:hypothetical protein [Herbiconiux flava]|uniref:Uncharacterized protein n=1 Tax=Herbiconiux flava TaxID=881268 RepID=A0A852SUA3_9MICO|nr:hypothetical protein [Herbiconiux flava]NYD72305.1 hypothetical protein [Herbiconiux flava]GLK17732.1 hypothetical protein GCM10017602_22140 [Herbiconiux flava]
MNDLTITINGSHKAHEQAPDQLRRLALVFLDAEQTFDNFEQSDALLKTAAQLRFVATMVEGGQADTDTGLLWIGAAHRLLLALDAARMSDAVHESRAQRRVPKPSDTMAAKRAYAQTRKAN